MLIFTDLHGCFLTFKKLYETVTAQFPKDEVAVAGDLPDRGPRTREVIQFIIDNNIPCIQGNHEDIMIDPKMKDCWFSNGGLKAFSSYCGCKDGLLFHGFDAEINKDHDCEGTQTLRKHKEFLKGLPYYLEFEDIKHENGRHLLITHAPIMHGKLENQVDKIGWDGCRNFIWNRNRPPRANYKKWFNVHGHTPQVNGPDITDWYANIDTGCAYAGRAKGYGKLTCLRFPEMEIYQQENIEGDTE